MMKNTTSRTLMLILTLLLSGRAMTLIFIDRIGGANLGDPPTTWLMPLFGDAIVGVSGLLVAYIIAKRTGLWAWTAIIVWNAVATWDALSAYLINTTDPWPDFFMLRLFGPSMFFVASALHLLIIYLACRSEVKRHYF